MKSIKLLAISSILIFILFSSCTSKENRVVADIKGLGNDTIFVKSLLIPDSTIQGIVVLTDTIIAHEGRFVYTFPDRNPYISQFIPMSLILKRENGSNYIPDSRMITVISEGKEIKINGNVESDYLSYKSKNKGFNKDYALHREEIKEIAFAIDSIEMLIDHHEYALEKSSVDRSVTDSLIQILSLENRENREKISEAKINYIQNHLNSELSAYYLLRMPGEIFLEYIDKLTPQVRKGVFENMLNESMRNAEEERIRKERIERVKEGKPAPDFTLKNLNGEEVALYDIQSKYIVLDFWGSWCYWCIIGFPQMKNYYEKYKGQLEIIGIACRDTDEAWQKSVKELQLPWIQLKNEDDLVEKNLSLMYVISGYPTKILLDENKTILKIFVGESEEFYKELDEILN